MCGEVALQLVDDGFTDFVFKIVINLLIIPLFVSSQSLIICRSDHDLYTKLPNVWSL